MRKVMINTKRLLLGFTVLLISVFLSSIKPTAVVDTYYHLAVGREVIQTHQIPQKDNFVYGSINTKYTSTEWLSGLIFYLFVNNLGINSLTLLKLIVSFATMVFFYWTLRLLGNNYWKNIFLILFSGYILGFRYFTRPEIFSFLFLAIISYVFLYYYQFKKTNKPIFLLPIIFVILPNIHGYATLGFGMSFLYLILIFNKYGTSIIREANCRKFIFILAICFILLAVQYKTLAFAFEAEKFSTYITEWVSLKERILPSDQFKGNIKPVTLDVYVYIISLFGLLIFSIFKFRDLMKNHKLINFGSYFLIFILPVKYYRLIQPVFLLTIPGLVTIIDENIYKLRTLRLLFPVAYSSLVTIILFSLITGHQLGATKIPWNDKFPENHKNFISENLNSQNLFTWFNWNDYFIYEVPGVKTFSDVMNQYRAKEDFIEERYLENTNTERLQLVRKFNIDTVLNIKGVSETGVYELDDWKLVYIDINGALYARNDIVNNYPLDLSVIHPELENAIKFRKEEKEKALKQLENLLGYDEKNSFARQQLILQYAVDKNYSAAIKFAKESIEVLPNNPAFPSFLAQIYVMQGNCELAKRYYREVKVKAFGDPLALEKLKPILDICQY